jgi:hypothetical protein
MFECLINPLGLAAPVPTYTELQHPAGSFSLQIIKPGLARLDADRTAKMTHRLQQAPEDVCMNGKRF